MAIDEPAMSPEVTRSWRWKVDNEKGASITRMHSRGMARTGEKEINKEKMTADIFAIGHSPGVLSGITERLQLRSDI